MKGIHFSAGRIQFHFHFRFPFSQDQKHFMSIAADLIIEGVQEPVRLQIGCRAKIFAEDERFWIANRRPLVEDYTLRMAPVKSALVLLFPTEVARRLSSLAVRSKQRGGARAHVLLNPAGAAGAASNGRRSRRHGPPGKPRAERLSEQRAGGCRSRHANRAGGAIR